ncbi:hypothetical protein DSO57_1002803 [Entomophthora muscae]|uniref:Uncharacterized protein n=1 Tax=Entomophthora muscae TaxID=34485 RepID=A0ACC2SAS0_9FUNG|nr:hypothetical protein DSO57_1002803 [Entomophthora muscae]
MFEYSSLYHEMGEKDGLQRLAARMYRYNALDRRISRFFEIGMISHFENMFVIFLTGLLGGAPYNRKSMVYCHRRINLGDEHFDAFLENLTVAMRHEQLSQDIIDRLLELIGQTRDDVCGRSTLRPPSDPKACPFQQPTSEKHPQHEFKPSPTLCPCVIQ